MASYSHEKVIRLDVPVDEVLVVDILNATNHLKENTQQSQMLLWFRSYKNYYSKIPEAFVSHTKLGSGPRHKRLPFGLGLRLT